MIQPPRTPRPALSLLPATLAVGAAVFGAAVAGFVLAGALPPGAAAPALLAAVTLGGAAAALALVRRRALPRRRAVADPAASGRLEVVALGDGQAAVLIDEPPVAQRPPRAAAAEPGDASAAAAAIWDAVGAAVQAAGATEADPAGRSRQRTATTGPGWMRWVRSRLNQGLRGGRRR